MIVHQIQTQFMLVNITTIRLMFGTKVDYESLSNEPEKKSFRAPEDRTLMKIQARVLRSDCL